MSAITTDQSRAADPGLRRLVPAQTAGPAAADQSPAGASVRSWPLLVRRHRPAAAARVRIWLMRPANAELGGRAASRRS